VDEIRFRSSARKLVSSSSSRFTAGRSSRQPATTKTQNADSLSAPIKAAGTSAPKTPPEPYAKAGASRGAVKPETSTPLSTDFDPDEPLIPLDRLKEKKPSRRERKKAKRQKFSTQKTPVNRWLILALVLTLTCLFCFVGYTFWSSRNPVLAKAKDPNDNSEQLALAIKDEVSRYLEDVPKETPKLETISDPNAAGVGFKDTQQGDKVLYFESAGKAIIYRPSTGKVIVYTYFTDSSGGGDTNSSNSEQTTQENTTSQTGTTIPTNQNGTDSGTESSSPSPLLP
jgi:hypothetical protein